MTNITNLNEQTALRMVVEGTAGETGEDFFVALVEKLCLVLNAQGAWVTEIRNEDKQMLHALAFIMNGQWITDFDMPIQGTPCEIVVQNSKFLHVPDNVVELYPGSNGPGKFGGVSYMGAPLLGTEGDVIGNLAILSTHPMPHDQRAESIFHIFAARASAEIRRIRLENEIRQNKEQLHRIIESAMDAIFELDSRLMIRLCNSAAEKVFGFERDSLVGRSLEQFLPQDSREKLNALIRNMATTGDSSLWIASGFRAQTKTGQGFSAEATLSRYERSGNIYYTVILRNVDDRIQAEEKIHSLSAEREYLREEISSRYNFDEIIGQSEALRRVFKQISQVAETDATVLLLGETGTGKELIARTIHSRSRRRDKPFVKVNCAAIPATLMESEFFGHEKGAFTGAVKKREGRFQLAHNGTIFLDEIGELPLDLQVKMLRVLQEGEFEPVGSSTTIKVNTRVIAATNRDLSKGIQNGEFREDLFYRLNVFPIRIPPLRERDDDVLLLADQFIARYAKKMGRKIAPLTGEAHQRLKSYHWPGNVRELENVIERAVITSENGNIHLQVAIPDRSDQSAIAEQSSASIRTAQELLDLERKNILLALEKTGWRVSGETGAARLLGMNPSTLNSRMKALGIARPKA